MKRLFSLKHSLELLAALITIGALLGVLQTFIIGKHFIIPTMILVLAVAGPGTPYSGFLLLPPATLFLHFFGQIPHGKYWAMRLSMFTERTSCFSVFLAGSMPARTNCSASLYQDNSRPL